LSGPEVSRRLKATCREGEGGILLAKKIEIGATYSDAGGEEAFGHWGILGGDLRRSTCRKDEGEGGVKTLVEDGGTPGRGNREALTSSCISSVSELGARRKKERSSATGGAVVRSGLKRQNELYSS